LALKLVVGLGNPGPEYARSRHNVGYLVAEALARDLGADFAVEKFAAELAEARAEREKVWIMKPRTYMNHSGEAVGAALRFWKLGLEDLLVVHDDLELEPFRIQLKVGGGHGGNKGIQSVNAHVGSPEYARVRVGIGRPPPRVDPADYVLGRWPRAEDARVDETVGRAAEVARLVCEIGVTKAMNEVNRRRKAAE
jgi:PTH1 family peptidyl-tRNA hydrolase